MKYVGCARVKMCSEKKKFFRRKKNFKVHSSITDKNFKIIFDYSMVIVFCDKRSAYSELYKNGNEVFAVRKSRFFLFNVPAEIFSFVSHKGSFFNLDKTQSNARNNLKCILYCTNNTKEETDLVRGTEVGPLALPRFTVIKVKNSESRNVPSNLFGHIKVLNKLDGRLMKLLKVDRKMKIAMTESLDGKNFDDVLAIWGDTSTPEEANSHVLQDHQRAYREVKCSSIVKITAVAIMGYNECDVHTCLQETKRFKRVSSS